VGENRMLFAMISSGSPEVKKKNVVGHTWVEKIMVG
jgi:hypothetical protein